MGPHLQVRTWPFGRGRLRAQWGYLRLLHLGQVSQHDTPLDRVSPTGQRETREREKESAWIVDGIGDGRTGTGMERRTKEGEEEGRGSCRGGKEDGGEVTRGEWRREGKDRKRGWREDERKRSKVEGRAEGRAEEGRNRREERERTGGGEEEERGEREDRRRRGKIGRAHV